MVEIRIAYQGNLRCTATHSESGTKLLTDAPKDNQGQGESFSPTDLVATALGTCMMTIMGIEGRRMGIDLSGATVVVKKEMVAAPLRRIGRLGVTINIPAKLSEEQKRRLENAARACPVHRSLHADVETPVTFNWA